MSVSEEGNPTGQHSVDHFTPTAQKPLMHWFVGSQQLADVVHFSCGAEQLLLGGAFEHTRPPSAPFGSQ
jgi:hypothetical protein